MDEPDHIPARLALAKVQIGLGDIPTAEKELQRAVELNAPPLDIERVHFSLLKARGEYTELLAGLARDEIVLPKEEQLDLRGQALLGLRQAAEAEETFRELLALVPGSASAGVGLAKARALQGEPAEAITLLEGVITASADNPDAWLALGNIHYGLAELRGCCDCLSRGARHRSHRKRRHRPHLRVAGTCPTVS